MKTTLTRIVTGISCAILTTSLTLPALAAEAPAKPEAASASISFTCALPEAETATEAAGVTYNADGTINVPTDDSVKYIPKDGDRVLCDDGFIYEVKDASRYDNNVFAEGPVGELPEPTCDWSLFPELELPKAEVRHFAHEYGDSMFIRNLYETRRMQYTLYNALATEPSAWQDGKPLDLSEIL